MSKFNDFYDNLTLSAGKTDEIMRAARNTEFKESIGTKSVYLTLGATLAAVLIMVYGGAFLINNGILLRTPVEEDIGFHAVPFEQPGAASAGGVVEPVSNDDIVIESLNRVAAVAKNNMTDFLQEQLLWSEHDGMRRGFSSVFVAMRSADTENIDVFVWNTDGYSNVFRSDGRDEFTVQLVSIFNDETLRDFMETDSTFVFILSGNMCTHAAFIPGVHDWGAMNLVQVLDNDELSFQAISDGRLTVNISDNLKQRQLVGTAPVMDYMPAEIFFGISPEYPMFEHNFTITEINRERGNFFICEETARDMAFRHAINSFSELVPPRTAFSTVITDVGFVNIAEYSYFILAYQIFGIAYTVEDEGDMASSRTYAIGERPVIENDSFRANFEIFINAETGEVISFHMH